MKNIANSFIMIFLFGILCPSYQAYAEGSKALVVVNKQQKKRLLIKSLAHSLSKDKVFENVFNNISALQFLNEISFLEMSDTEKEVAHSKLNALADKNEALTDSEFNEAGKIMHFANQQDAEAFNTNILGSLLVLKNTYEGLNGLNEIEIQEVSQLAIEEGNLQSKFKKKVFESTEECFSRIKDKYFKCQSDGIWWANVAFGVSIACYVTMVALAIASFLILISQAEVLLPFLTNVYDAAIAASEAAEAAEGSALGYVRVTITAITNAVRNGSSVAGLKSLLRAGMRCVIGVFAYICSDTTYAFFGAKQEKLLGCHEVYKNDGIVCMGQEGIIAGMGAVTD